MLPKDTNQNVFERKKMSQAFKEDFNGFISDEWIASDKLEICLCSSTLTPGRKL